VPVKNTAEPINRDALISQGRSTSRLFAASVETGQGGSA
jgi:hypothetical protein